MPDDVAELDALRRLGVSRVLVPASGGAGLASRIRGPEDLAGWTEVIDRHQLCVNEGVVRYRHATSKSTW